MVDCVLWVCDLLSSDSGVWPLSDSNMNIYWIVTLAGLIYKAISLGMVQFQGRLYSFCFRISSINASSPIAVRVVIGGIRARILRP